MDALIDQVLGYVLNAAIWHGMRGLDNWTLLIVGVGVFIIMAIRRRK